MLIHATNDMRCAHTDTRGGDRYEGAGKRTLLKQRHVSSEVEAAIGGMADKTRP